MLNSSPQGARVYVNGKDTGKDTPCSVRIKKRQFASSNNASNEIVYKFKKDNYQEGIINDISTYNPLAAISWVCYVVPGFVDVATGATRMFKTSITANLNPISSGSTDTVYKIVTVPSTKQAYVFKRKSDVDRNIPKTGSPDNYRFALIIGNEDYSSKQMDLNSEINVDFARNDASAFKEYATSTLRVPEKNVVFLTDGTTGQMNQAISKMNLILKNTSGKAEVLVYYAGHGLPDEVTKEPYLMPVDVSSKNAFDGIKLSEMYSKLTEYPSKRITVFIDACFSGGARNQGLLAARGVRIQANSNALKGNVVVFTASSGTQSSLPYKQQEHGLFTYYLLKKFQKSGASITYSEMSTYLSENVGLQSVMINEKEQNPQTNVSPPIQEEWKDYTFE